MKWDTVEGKRTFLAVIRRSTSSEEPLYYLMKGLTIYAPFPIPRDHTELIGTPGLDDTEDFQVLLTERSVKDVDAILFLTVSGASYGQSDREFVLRQLRLKQMLPSARRLQALSVRWRGLCRRSGLSSTSWGSMVRSRTMEAAHLRARWSRSLMVTANWQALVGSSTPATTAFSRSTVTIPHQTSMREPEQGNG